MKDKITYLLSENTVTTALIYLAITTLVLINISNSFFWDTIQLGSQHATFYYSTDFLEFFLPNQLDSGHIPTFGMALAFLWKIFGRTLEVGHLAMLPFAIGIVYLLFKFCNRFIPFKYLPAAVILILADPAILSQMTLVSPDVPLLFFFLLSLNALFDNKRLLLSISILFMFLISMRGMMVAICLLMVDIYLNTRYSTFRLLVKDLFRQSFVYLPPVLVFAIFNFYHFEQKGWIGFHDGSPWAESFQKVDFQGFVRNIILLVWRLIDHGKIVIWLVFGYLAIRYRQQIKTSKYFKQLLFLVVCLLVILPLNMLWAKGLMGHRYLLPITVGLSLFTAVLLFSELVPKRHKIILASIWFIGLSTGNFWIYPKQISQGWDVTLAHLPYYKLRQQAIDYLAQNDIPLSETGSFFPNTASLDAIDLSNSDEGFAEFGNQNYVLYSTIFNCTDEELNALSRDYDAVKEFSSGQIDVIIYKRKSS